MSRSIDLFIDCRRPIEEVAAEIQRLTGLSLAEGPHPTTWLLEEGGLTAELRANPFIDDGDLLLQRFPFTLSARVAGDVRLVDAPATTLLRLVSEALHNGGLPNLLVHDLQFRDQVAAAAGPPRAPAAEPTQ